MSAMSSSRKLWELQARSADGQTFAPVAFSAPPRTRAPRCGTALVTAPAPAIARARSSTRTRSAGSSDRDEADRAHAGLQAVGVELLRVVEDPLRERRRTAAARSKAARQASPRCVGDLAAVAARPAPSMAPVHRVVLHAAVPEQGEQPVAGAARGAISASAASPSNQWKAWPTVTASTDAVLERDRLGGARRAPAPRPAAPPASPPPAPRRSPAAPRRAAAGSSLPVPAARSSTAAAAAAAATSVPNAAVGVARPAALVGVRASARSPSRRLGASGISRQRRTRRAARRARPAGAASSGRA